MIALPEAGKDGVTTLVGEPDPQRPSLIVTVAGSGYKFAAAVREAEPGSTPETAEAANPSNIPLRKLAAILAADVAGFSRLVGAHEDRSAPCAAGPCVDLPARTRA